MRKGAERELKRIRDAVATLAKAYVDANGPQTSVIISRADMNYLRAGQVAELREIGFEVETVPIEVDTGEYKMPDIDRSQTRVALTVAGRRFELR
jgi:hypothetical protein